MGAPVFGIAIRRVDREPRPVYGADLSTIGLIGPAPAADPLIFPLDTPVLVYSNDNDKVGKLGAQGYLKDAIQGINDQLGEGQFAARVVVVRTAPGASDDPSLKTQGTIGNVLGSSVDGTGLWAFLKSGEILGVIPRLIIAPGYTGQMANNVNEVTRATPGSGYIEGQSYPLTFSAGGVNATIVQATAHALGQSDGGLGQAVIDTNGAWYTEAPTVTAPSAGKRVTAVAIAAGGTGHTVGDEITLGNGVVVTVSTVNAGVITAATITTPGLIGPSATPPANPIAQVTTTGTGIGATFNLTWTLYTAATYTATVAIGANPVVAGLTGVLNGLFGHAIVESTGSSEQNDVDWRETINSQRIIPISGGVKVFDSVAGVVTRPLAPRIAGIAVRRDKEMGAPFHSWANQPVQGVIGPGRDMSFNIVDDANEGQRLLLANIGVVVRGEVGVDFAISNGGFIFIGTDVATDDPLWQFYNVTRGRDYIHLGVLRTYRTYLGRFNITGHTIQALLNTLGFFLRDLKADEHILGYRVNFNPDSNSPEEIRLGHLTVAFAAEEPPVLRRITVESSRYRPAIEAMVSQLEAQLNLSMTA